MILDYNPIGGYYVLTVRRDETPPVDTLMREYGLDFSVPASTTREAVLFTKDPFCAASFHASATPAARDKLGWIVREVGASWAPSSSRHIALPPDKELWPFQVADCDYLLNREHGLDGDEPGLGKTPTAIAIANERQAKRVLVVCPASIRFQWVRRVQEWTTMRSPFICIVTASKYGTSDAAEWTVISYELARNPAILRSLVKQHFD